MRPRGLRQSAARRFAARVSDAVRSTIAPAELVIDQAPAIVSDPADVYTDDALPPVADIEAAAAEFERATDQARRADRGKRAARKILDRLPAGIYGEWLVSRTPSSRQTADLDAIRETYKRLGLGPVPMKSSAPSLKVERIEVPAAVTA
ncbi:hypothetical protein K7862_19085 [Streptomyces sp. PLK6-54]|uniref:Uncharacterized protein n=2 Tax=Actinacidiphila acidipaludis TaxID=2873382 RepID=A0ABS7Q989_9ACTN|nr:hypothetical protein [Streptomyces acidipaludis]